MKHSIKPHMVLRDVDDEQRHAIKTLAEIYGISVFSIEPHPIRKDVTVNGIGELTVCDFKDVQNAYRGGAISISFEKFITAMLTPKKESEKEFENNWDKFLLRYLKKTAGEEKAAAIWKRLNRVTSELDAEEMLMKNSVEDRSHMSPVQRINALESEVEALKQELVKAKMKVNATAFKFTDFIEMMNKSLKDVTEGDERSGGQFKTPLDMVAFMQEENDKLKFQVEALKQKLAEAEKKVEPEKKPVEEDRRVDFGDEVTFKVFRSSSNGSAFIGESLAKEADKHKVLIANKGYTFKIRENYLNGRPALEIHRV
jgi:hypothetical protein